MIQSEKILSAVRAQSALIHNITNYVVMNWTANCLLAVGASPVMAHAGEEAQAMTGLASALAINIGTLSEPWVKSMRLSMDTAQHKKIPIVFDPVGVGATSYRTDTARQLLDDACPTVIRGNASEINALAGLESTTKGVDSVDASNLAIESARKLANSYECVVCVSGAIDFVVEKNKIYEIKNGHPLMARVTGMGCAATALIGAFVATGESPFDATVAAMTVTGIAGELSAKKSSGPGTFQVNYLDFLDQMDGNLIRTYQKAKLL